MALCGTASKTEEQKANDLIDKQLRADRKKTINEIKLLLLGTGESGKSTVMKQMKIICMDGFSKEEREGYRSIIHSNIVESMATLVQEAERSRLTISPELMPIATKLTTSSQYIGTFLNKSTASSVGMLWRDPAIQQTYGRRSKFQLVCSDDYLLNHAERLLSPNAEIEDSDILHARLPTRGVVEVQFELDRTQFRVVDVGGQRSERKKWLQCFASVTAVIFCVALNEYDEKLFEDENVNRMTEAIALFKQVVNHKCFNDPREPTSIIIFLNKSDLFEKKITQVPLEHLFHDYKGGPDPKAGTEFILQKLLSQSESPQKDKLIFHHVTCATNTENIRLVFNAVKMTVLTRNLEEAQIM